MIGEILDARILSAIISAVGDVAGEDPAPTTVLDMLGAIRLLDKVPFEYLVPDDELLPAESIRFFHLDRNWTDALVDGAVAAGAFTTRDRMIVAARHQEIRDEVDRSELNLRSSSPELQPPAGRASGFLLRSALVSCWPGLRVWAYGDHDDDRVVGLRTLRLVRLAPAVLFAVFDGTASRIFIEEPRSGVQFGVDPRPGSSAAFEVNPRDPDTGDRVGDPVRVPLRSSVGTVNVVSLVDRLLDEAPAALGTTMSTSELALQLIQYPYRQEFSTEEPAPDWQSERRPLTYRWHQSNEPLWRLP